MMNEGREKVHDGNIMKENGKGTNKVRVYDEERERGRERLSPRGCESNAFCYFFFCNPLSFHFSLSLL